MHAERSDIQITLRGADDVLMRVQGPLDPGSTRRLAAMLHVVLVVGARRLIVDLSSARDVPASTVDLLQRVRDALRRRGGWLLVDGGPPSAAGLGPSLLEAFAAFRDVVGPDAGAGTDSGRRRSAS